MLYSVGDMLEATARKMSGPGVDPTCEPGLSQALAEYNRVSRRLLNDRELFFTAFVCLEVHGDYISLDRAFQRILQAKNSRTKILVPGQSFRFIDGVEFSRCPGSEYRRTDAGFDGLIYQGANFPVVRDLDKPRVLFAVSDRPEDENVQLTVVGYDENGAELRTVGQNGSFQKGIFTPITQTSCADAPTFNCGDGYHRGLVSRISMLRKPRTRGYVQVWGLDELTQEVYWLTTMAPDELSPSLTRYSVHGCQGGSLFAEVSLQWVPAYDPNEIALIQQPDAVEAMTQALTLYDVNDLGGFTAYRNTARSLIKNDVAAKDGSTHRVNVRVRTAPLKGRNYSMRYDNFHR